MQKITPVPHKLTEDASPTVLQSPACSVPYRLRRTRCGVTSIIPPSQSCETSVARHPFRISRDHEPAFALVSYGRRGPGRPERFAPEQVAQIARTVRRAPEVMVKVSGGGNSLGAVV